MTITTAAIACFIAIVAYKILKYSIIFVLKVILKVSEENKPKTREEAFVEMAKGARENGYGSSIADIMKYAKDMEQKNS